MSDFFPVNSPFPSLAVTESTAPTIATDDESQQLAFTVAAAASERKAGEIILLRVAEVSYLADYFVMLTGYSRVQVRAIADAVEKEVEEKLHRLPLRSEGKMEGSWVLHDYGDVIVHVMMPKEREFYNLEAFWGHAERIEFDTSDEGGGKAR